MCSVHAVHTQCKVFYVGNYVRPTLLLTLSDKLPFFGCKMSLILLMTCILLDFV